MAAAEEERRRAALVTGGNRGIGLEVAKVILEESPAHFVYLGSRDLQAGRAAADDLRKRFGDRVEAVRLDMADPRSIKEAVMQVGNSQHQLDILVNNGGILLEGDGAPFDLEAVRQTMRVNFHGVVSTTLAFLPLLAHAPGGGHVLSTSSGTATRAMGLLSEDDRKVLTDPSLDLDTLSVAMDRLVEGLANPNSAYHSIPTVGYSLSKVGVNCFTQFLAREQKPPVRANACSPGFCNTGMCANYTGSRKPKSPALGATVFGKVLFGELGRGQTGAFYKEASKPDTPIDEAVSVLEPWVAMPAEK